MSDTCGHTSLRAFAHYDRATSCWRTSEGTFPWGSDEWSATWPTAGIACGGRAFELPMSALRTGGPGCSSLLSTPQARDYKGRPADGFNQANLVRDVENLLPTPVVNDMGEGKTPEKWDDWTDEMRERHGNGNGHGRSLAIEAQRLLPAPRATRGGSATETVRLLPTPTSSDSKATRQQSAAERKAGGHILDLSDVAKTIGMETPTEEEATEPTMFSDEIWRT